MIFEDGHLTEEATKQLAEHADMIECECPTYLLEILAKVREFHGYTGECITRYPKDAGTHRWLQTAARNVDSMLSSTIAQLARIEGFIDDQNNFVSRPAAPPKETGSPADAAD